jgi:hypothetical protein
VILFFAKQLIVEPSERWMVSILPAAAIAGKGGAFGVAGQ